MKLLSATATTAVALLSLGSTGAFAKAPAVVNLTPGWYNASGFITSATNANGTCPATGATVNPSGTLGTPVAFNARIFYPGADKTGYKVHISVGVKDTLDPAPGVIRWFLDGSGPTSGKTLPSGPGDVEQNWGTEQNPITVHFDFDALTPGGVQTHVRGGALSFFETFIPVGPFSFVGTQSFTINSDGGNSGADTNCTEIFSFSATFTGNRSGNENADTE